MNAMSRALSCSLGSLLLCSAAAAQGALIVVDAAGGAGAQATEIAEAVAMAPTGATLLVRTGVYAPFTIADRSLVIVAAPDSTVNVDSSLAAGGFFPPAVTVRDVPAGKVVVLEGLKFHGVSSPFDPSTVAVEISHCAGQVWLQDCFAGTGFGPGPSHAAIHVTDSHDVVITHGQVIGGSFLVAQGVANNIGPALAATGSRVFAYESSFLGGSGGAGALLGDGFLFAENSSFRGGDGVGQDAGFGCILSVDGGPGLQLGAGSPTVILLDTLVQGGSPDFFNGCSEAGPPTSIDTGTLQVLPGEALAFTVDSPAPDDSTPTILLSGPPGDVGALLMALSLPPVTYFPKYEGALVTGSPILFLVGALPPSGTLHIPLHLNDALPTGTGSTIFLQSAVLHGGGGALLGGPAQLTSFDE